MLTLRAMKVKVRQGQRTLFRLRGLVLARGNCNQASLREFSNRERGEGSMSSADKKPQAPIGDPPTRNQRVRADGSSGKKQPEAPMMDPFTEQSTHSAGHGQGANASNPTSGNRKKNTDNGDDEETMPIEDGFSPVP
jgi:hypothetical protein